MANILVLFGLISLASFFTTVILYIEVRSCTTPSSSLPRFNVYNNCKNSDILKGVPPFKRREDLGTILQSENMTKGVELGVQKGHLTKSILLLWSSAEEHLLVDLWGQQENYVDIANVNDVAQEHNYQDALENTVHWADKRRICRNFTTVCANDEEDEYFDFVYIDARHDFMGVYEGSCEMVA